MEVTVTYKNNVQHNDEGEMLFHADGSVALIDESIVGLMLKTHLVQVSQVNQTSNLLETGIVPKCEVIWEHNRCPAPALENPDDLVWLAYGSEDSEEPDEGDEDEIDAHEYEDDEESASADTHVIHQ